VHKKFGFSKNQYSLLAAGVLNLATVQIDASAIYTDLEPDLELSFDGDMQFLDIDNNGSIDFGFLKSSFSYSYFSTFSASYRQVSRRGLWAGPYALGNKLAGEYFTIGGGAVYEPFKLNYLDVISENLSFQVAPFQLIALVTKRLDIPDDWGYDHGNWFGINDNKFLGFRFENGDECNHYGWIRCTIEEDLSKLIIHDYAYESNCETPIAAGDMLGDTTTEITSLLSEVVSIYSLDKDVFIHLSNITGQFQVSILDLNGKKLFNQSFNENHIHIPTQLNPGIYFVVVIQDGMQTAKKIVLM
jgi:hypothetical protein